jgi:hypothetical protein
MKAVSTSYTKTWRNITDKELTRVLDIVKRMEKGGWVCDSYFTVDDTPNEVRLSWQSISGKTRESILLGPGKNTITWHYRTVR